MDMRRMNMAGTEYFSWTYRVKRLLFNLVSQYALWLLYTQWHDNPTLVKNWNKVLLYWTFFFVKSCTSPIKLLCQTKKKAAVLWAASPKLEWPLFHIQSFEIFFTKLTLYLWTVCYARSRFSMSPTTNQEHLPVLCVCSHLLCRSASLIRNHTRGCKSLVWQSWIRLHSTSLFDLVGVFHSNVALLHSSGSLVYLKGQLPDNIPETIVFYSSLAPAKFLTQY